MLIRNRCKLYWPKFFLFCVIYYLSAKACLALDAVSGFAAPIWIPSGLALVALYNCGINLWPAILLSSAAVNFSTGAPIPIAIMIGLGNASGAFLSYYFLRRFGRPGNISRLDRIHKILVLVVLASAMGPMVSATSGVSSLWLGGIVPSTALNSTWFAWWIGDMMGILIITPILFIWRNPPQRPFALSKIIEGALLLLSVLLICTFIFFECPNLFSNFKEIYFLFPFILWTAIRFKQHGVVLLSLLFTVFSIWATVKGFGPFAFTPLHSGLITLQTFIFVASITGLVMAAVVSELLQEKKLLEFSLISMVHKKIHLGQLINSAIDGIIEMDHRGRIIQFNPMAERIFGFSYQNVIGRNLADLLIPTSMRKAHELGLKKFLESGKGPMLGKRIEVSGLRSDGTEVPLELSVICLGIKGSPIFLGHIRDITERQAIQREREAQQSRLEGLVQERTVQLQTVVRELSREQDQLEEAQSVAHIGSWEMDIKNNKINWSKELSRIYGSAQEGEGDRILSTVSGMDKFMERIHQEDKAVAVKTIQEAIANKRDFDFKHRIVLSNGSTKFIHERGKVVLDSEGRPSKMVGTAQDITDMKKIEDEKERFFNLSVDLQCIAGLNGYFYRVNPAFERTLGYTREELLEIKYLDFVHPDDLGNAVKELEELASGVPTVYFEVRLRCKNGNYKWVAWTSIPVMEENIIYAIGRDITETKIVGEKIRSSLKEKETLLKEIHHRVKNNLQITSSLLKLQSEKIQDAAMLEVFAESENRIRSMALVHEKLYQSRDLTKIEFGEYVQDLVNHLTKSYMLDTGKIKILIDINKVFISVDKAIPCALILNELISNSIKHAFRGLNFQEQEGVIRISFSRATEGNQYKLVLSDNGIGFPPGMDIRDYTSLGLRLVINLSHQIGGTVDQSKGDDGKGSRFSIAFSIAD